MPTVPQKHEPRKAAAPIDELSSFLQNMSGPGSLNPNNPLNQQGDPSANLANPLMNPSNPGAWNNPSNPQLNPYLPGSAANPSNPEYNPSLPGSSTNPSNPQRNPSNPGALTNPSNPMLNPAYPGSLTNPANPMHNPAYPAPSDLPRPPGISEDASVPPSRLGWRRMADNYTQDAREWPDPTEPRPGIAPDPHGCTCAQGRKLDCPIHGLNAPDSEMAGRSWHVPEGNPIGYPQEPRTWMDAVQSSEAAASPSASASGGQAISLESASSTASPNADRHVEDHGNNEEQDDQQEGHEEADASANEWRMPDGAKQGTGHHAGSEDEKEHAGSVSQLWRLAKDSFGPQKCEYCKSPAAKALLWAEGMAYIPVCDQHEAKGKHRIEVTNHDEVVSTRPIKQAKSLLSSDSLKIDTYSHGREPAKVARKPQKMELSGWRVGKFIKPDFGCGAFSELTHDLSRPQLDAFFEYAVQHNRADRDSGELEDIPEAEVKRLLREWRSDPKMAKAWIAASDSSLVLKHGNLASGMVQGNELISPVDGKVAVIAQDVERDTGSRCGADRPNVGAGWNQGRDAGLHSVDDAAVDDSEGPNSGTRRIVDEHDVGPVAVSDAGVKQLVEDDPRRSRLVMDLGDELGRGPVLRSPAGEAAKRRGSPGEEVDQLAHGKRVSVGLWERMPAAHPAGVPMAAREPAIALKGEAAGPASDDQHEVKRPARRNGDDADAKAGKEARAHSARPAGQLWQKLIDGDLDAPEPSGLLAIGAAMDGGFDHGGGSGSGREGIGSTSADMAVAARSDARGDVTGASHLSGPQLDEDQSIIEAEVGMADGHDAMASSSMRFADSFDAFAKRDDVGVLKVDDLESAHGSVPHSQHPGGQHGRQENQAHHQSERHSDQHNQDQHLGEHLQDRDHGLTPSPRRESGEEARPAREPEMRRSLSRNAEIPSAPRDADPETDHRSASDRSHTDRRQAGVGGARSERITDIGSWPALSMMGSNRTAAYFHVAPSAERQRIQQHGLQPSNPASSGMWKTFGDGQYEPPSGVYMFNDPARADTYRTTLEFRRGVPHDVWSVVLPRQPQKDPDLAGSAHYLDVPVSPDLLTLHEGPEHREYMPEYMRPQYLQPTDPWQRGEWPMAENEGRGQPYPQNDPSAWQRIVGSNQLNFEPGPTALKRSLWGRGLVTQQGGVYSWPEEYATHAEMARRLGEDPFAYKQHFLISPQGTFFGHNARLDPQLISHVEQQAGLRYDPKTEFPTERVAGFVAPQPDEHLPIEDVLSQYRPIEAKSWPDVRARFEQRYPEHMEALRQSIAKGGMLNPVQIDRERGVVGDGHTRLLAAQDLGMTHVPVIYREHGYWPDTDDWVWDSDTDEHSYDPPDEPISSPHQARQGLDPWFSLSTNPRKRPSQARGQKRGHPRARLGTISAAHVPEQLDGEANDAEHERKAKAHQKDGDHLAALSLRETAKKLPDRSEDLADVPVDRAGRHSTLQQPLGGMQMAKGSGQPIDIRAGHDQAMNGNHEGVEVLSQLSGRERTDTHGLLGTMDNVASHARVLLAQDIGATADEHAIGWDLKRLNRLAISLDIIPGTRLGAHHDHPLLVHDAQRTTDPHMTSDLSMSAPLSEWNRPYPDAGRHFGDLFYSMSDENRSPNGTRETGPSNGSHLGTVTRDEYGNPSVVPWRPGAWGKGMLVDGEPHIWETESPGGSPHHMQYGRSIGYDPANASPEEWERYGDYVVIAPDGSYAVDPSGTKTRAPEAFAQKVPGLRFMRDVSRWNMRAFGSHKSSEAVQHSMLCPHCGAQALHTAPYETSLHCRACGHSTPNIGWDDPESWAESGSPMPWEGMVTLPAEDRSPELINPEGWNFGPRRVGSHIGRTADLYHVAPTIERERIRQHGLQPADPYHDPRRWFNREIWDSQEKPPIGVYGMPSEQEARAWRYLTEQAGQPSDIWHAPGEALLDPDIPGAAYLPHRVRDPRLLEGPEHWARLTDPIKSHLRTAEVWEGMTPAWERGMSGNRKPFRYYPDADVLTLGQWGTHHQHLNEDFPLLEGGGRRPSMFDQVSEGELKRVPSGKVIVNPWNSAHAADVLRNVQQVHPEAILPAWGRDGMPLAPQQPDMGEQTAVLPREGMTLPVDAQRAASQQRRYQGVQSYEDYQARHSRDDACEDDQSENGIVHAGSLPVDPMVSKIAGETASQRLRRAQELEAQLGPDQSQTVHSFPDGWSVKQLQTYADAMREGHLMGNCFAHNTTDFPHEVWQQHPQFNGRDEQGELLAGQYWQKPENPDYSHPLPESLYSLRDPHNLPHASIDPEADRDSMALGRHNGPVRPEYQQRIGEWWQAQSPDNPGPWYESAVRPSTWRLNAEIAQDPRQAADHLGVWPWTDKLTPSPTPEEAAKGRRCFFHSDRPAVRAEGFAPMCAECSASFARNASLSGVTKSAYMPDNVTEDREASWRPLSGDFVSDGPWEAKMFHGSERGLLGPVRTPFWATSHEPEAKGFGPVVHPVSVRFHRPMHLFGDMRQMLAPSQFPQLVDQASGAGRDGIVVYHPEDMRDPSDPYPRRQWAIALDPGAIVPGHLPDLYD